MPQKSSIVPSEPKFGLPPNKKFLDPPLNCSPILWPSHSFCLFINARQGNTRGTYCKLNSIFSVVESTTSMHSITANNQCAVSDVYK